MAATRKDRGNSWASRAPLNDDRAPIRSWPSWSKQLFQHQAEPAAGSQVIVLPLADWWTHSIRRQTAGSREHFASDVGTDPQKIFFVKWWAAFGVFFSVRATIVASLDGQQDVHLLAAREELNRRHARALSVSFERPRSPTWTSPQLTTRAFLQSSSLCHCVLCECHNNGRCQHERRHPFLELVPRSAHLPSQWHTSSKSLERDLRPHCRFLLPVTHALGDEIAETSFGRRAEPNTRIKNRYRYSCRC